MKVHSKIAASLRTAVDDNKFRLKRYQLHIEHLEQYIMRRSMPSELTFQDTVFIFKASRKAGSQGPGRSMGANVCPKYEGVFRDRPVFPLQFK